MTFGEIMLRVAVPLGQRLGDAGPADITYGGGEANVAIGLARLGIEAVYATRLPANPLGDGAIRFLRGAGVDTSAIVRGGSRLGTYFLEPGVAQRGSLVVYDRAASSLAEIAPGDLDWPSVLRGATWFHLTGITPAVSERAADASLAALESARLLGLTTSIDLNYRSKLWRWGRTAGEVMPELVRVADVVVGNEEDAAKVFGIAPRDADLAFGRIDAERYVDVARELVDRFPNLRTVAITLRESHSASHNTWAGALWADDAFHLSRRYEINPIVDRVGAGDAFAAALIAGLLEPGKPADAVLDFAVAASCLKHGFVGDANPSTRDEIERLAAGDAGGRVSR